MRNLLMLIFISTAFATTLLIPSDEYPTIQAGIDAAEAGDTVLITSGTYSPETGEIFPIIMISNINLIGEDEETTILDAQQTGTVVTMDDCEINTISNLTITGGMGSDAGGMYLQSSNPILTHVTISNNAAENYGAGMRLSNSDPILTYVTISNNTADYGGGMHVGYSNPILTHVTISNNQALQGGGMRLVSSDPILTHVTISNNTASEGGGMRLFSCNAILTYVTISNNTAEYGGGGMWLDYSNSILTHTTISNNTSEYYGGGMRLSNSNPTLINVTIADNIASEGGGMLLSNSSPTLTNSILWDNAPESVDLYQGEGPIITYSNIEGGWGGEGNINADLLFIDSENGDYTLQENSPCIDAGTSDLDGDGIDDITDYYGSAPDMGAYEYNPDNDLSNEELLPTNYSLSPAYPNPFNPITNINFSVPNHDRVSISIYDISGRLVTTLSNHYYNPGHHSITWNANSYASGVYFIKMQSADFLKTQKVMLMK